MPFPSLHIFGSLASKLPSNNDNENDNANANANGNNDNDHHHHHQQHHDYHVRHSMANCWENSQHFGEISASDPFVKPFINVRNII